MQRPVYVADAVDRPRRIDDPVEDRRLEIDLDIVARDHADLELGQLALEDRYAARNLVEERHDQVEPGRKRPPEFPEPLDDIDLGLRDDPHAAPEQHEREDDQQDGVDARQVDQVPKRSEVHSLSCPMPFPRRGERRPGRLAREAVWI